MQAIIFWQAVQVRPDRYVHILFGQCQNFNISILPKLGFLYRGLKIYRLLMSVTTYLELSIVDTHSLVLETLKIRFL